MRWPHGMKMVKLQKAIPPLFFWSRSLRESARCNPHIHLHSSAHSKCPLLFRSHTHSTRLFMNHHWPQHATSVFRAMQEAHDATTAKAKQKEKGKGGGRFVTLRRTPSPMQIESICVSTIVGQPISLKFEIQIWGVNLQWKAKPVLPVSFFLMTCGLSPTFHSRYNRAERLYHVQTLASTGKENASSGSDACLLKPR